MKGFRTILFNAIGVAAPALVTWAAGIDWTQYVSPVWAPVVIAGINVALRYVTTGPVGTKA